LPFVIRIASDLVIRHFSFRSPDFRLTFQGSTRSTWRATGPRNAASVLRVSIDAQTNTAILRFLAGSNHAYTIQYRDALGNSPWLDFTNLPPASTNRTIVCKDPLPAGMTNRFYRVSAP
jgi:hypothetical protein